MVEGEIKPLTEKNVLPSIESGADQLGLALLLAATGIALILLIELGLARTRKER